MLSLLVNGEQRRVMAEADKPLLWVLRDELDLKGTKYGCGVGICGICTVLIDGEAQHACMVPLSKAKDRAVMTVEGLAKAQHPLVQAWITHQVPQCGYCQPGQLMAATALLNKHPNPSDSEMDDALSGVLCRCGTYQRIRRAIHSTVSQSLSRPSGDTDTRSGFIQSPFARRMPDVRKSHVTGETSGFFAPNAWVRILPNDTVTIVIDRSEMGQGVTTSLAMLVAEELEVDLAQVHVEFAPANPVYNNPVFDVQLTGGSTSVRGEWLPLRRAGAEAREMLIGAAADHWQVPRSECHATQGRVMHSPSGRHVSYGALATMAATQTVPRDIELKQPEDFRLIGQPVPRLEIPDLVMGNATYGIDLHVPEQLVATVLRAPELGGRVTDYDSSAALGVPGVRHVVAIDSGVAVVADDFWSACLGRQALSASFGSGPHSDLSSAEIYAGLEQALQRKGKVARQEGNDQLAMKEAARRVEAIYQTPYLAHATLEPMNCTAHVRADGCDVWVGTQNQTDTWDMVAKITGLPKDEISIHTTFLGGGFGRRLETDFVAEAVAIAQAVKLPVQLLWTRQDDMQHDKYRPAHSAFLQAGLDENGSPVVWFQRIAGPALALDGIDVPYAIPNFCEERVRVESSVPTGPWRSVGASQNAFVIECFVDELAHVAGKDPLAFRLALLPHAPRHRRVLELVAEKSGWGTTPYEGRHRGVAVYHSFGSCVAQVAEITITDNRTIRVPRVVCAIDCGMTVNPDALRAQLEGGVAFGLSAVLKEEILIAQGQVQQGTFQDYPILTMAEMPEVEVYVVPSQEPPGGVGEPGVPPIAPAVANAVFAATGQRLRRLPLRLA